MAGTSRTVGGSSESKSIGQAFDVQVLTPVHVRTRFDTQRMERLRPTNGSDWKQCAAQLELGAMLGATQMNNLGMIRTRLDNQERRARGGGLF
jgi:hypothetical protein